MIQTLKETLLPVILFLILSVGLFFGFHTLVYEYVRPPQGESRDTMMAAFDGAFIAVMIASIIAVAAWYALARFSRVVRPTDAGKRSAWLVILLVLAVVAIILATVFFGRPLDGSWLAYLLLVLPALIAFYLPTALFSPADYKYSPLGATVLRPRRW